MGASGLEGFIEEVTGESHLRVEEDFGGGFVRLRMSEADRRQAQQDIRGVEDIVLELLRNSRDAGARMICVATNRDGATRNIVVIDDGEGIPPEMQERVFEPRVTSRLDSFHADQWGVHGRGMALFSIACNSTVHKVAKSGIGKGSAIQVVADTTRLSEKADQSTIPHLVIDDNGGIRIAEVQDIAKLWFLIGDVFDMVAFVDRHRDAGRIVVQQDFRRAVVGRVVAVELVVYLAACWWVASSQQGFSEALELAALNVKTQSDDVTHLERILVSAIAKEVKLHLAREGAIERFHHIFLLFPLAASLGCAALWIQLADDFSFNIHFLLVVSL